MIRLLLAALLALMPAMAAEDLLEASQSGNLDRVKALVSRGNDVNQGNRYGATPLLFAAQHGHNEIVTYLLENGAKADFRDSFYHMSPLLWAVSAGAVETSALLIPHTDSDLNDALMMSINSGHVGIIKAIVEKGPIEAGVLKAARAAASQKPVVLQELEPAKSKADKPPLKHSLEQLKAVEATFASAGSAVQSKMVLEIRDGVLHALINDEVHALEAVGARDFRFVADTSAFVQVGGRDTSIERASVVRDGQVTFYRPVEEEGPETAATVADAPSKTYERGAPINWPSFRGDAASGAGDGQGIPSTWDVESGKNIAWKTEVPGTGHSSPVIWEDKVFLTTAIVSSGRPDILTGSTGTIENVMEDEEHTWKTLAYNVKDGSLAWEHTVAKAKPKTPRHGKATQANSTVVTNGKHLVAVYPTAGMVCYDLDGNVKWHIDLGGLDAGWFYEKTRSWGFAASPIIYKNTVILQVDIQETPYIAAWDLDSGKQLWRTERDEIPTWATPAIYSGPKGDELIANGTTIMGYDPNNGKELWRLGPNSEVIIATPVIWNDHIYVCSSYPPVRPIYAIKGGSRGDLTLPDGATSSDAITWSTPRGGSYMPSPLIYEGVYYVVHHQPRIMAYDAKTGEELYRARFSQRSMITGSPVVSDGRMFIPTEDGGVFVVQTGKQFKELGHIDMGETIMTTPSVAQGKLFIRTVGHLFAIADQSGS